MGCLIFSIVSIYFNFFGYRLFKQLSLEIYEYEQKIIIQEWTFNDQSLAQLLNHDQGYISLNEIPLLPTQYVRKAR